MVLLSHSQSKFLRLKGTSGRPGGNFIFRLSRCRLSCWEITIRVLDFGENNFFTGEMFLSQNVFKIINSLDLLFHLLVIFSPYSSNEFEKEDEQSTKTNDKPVISTGNIICPVHLGTKYSIMSSWHRTYRHLSLEAILYGL